MAHQSGYKSQKLCQMGTWSIAIHLQMCCFLCGANKYNHEVQKNKLKNKRGILGLGKVENRSEFTILQENSHSLNKIMHMKITSHSTRHKGEVQQMFISVHKSFKRSFRPLLIEIESVDQQHQQHLAVVTNAEFQARHDEFESAF